MNYTETNKRPVIDLFYFRFFDKDFMGYIKDEARYMKETSECITYKRSKNDIEEYLHSKYGNKMLGGNNGKVGREI